MPEFLVSVFEHLTQHRASMNDQVQAKQFVESGKRHIAAEDWDSLNQINACLWDLMPSDARKEETARLFTGIM